MTTLLLHDNEITMRSFITSLYAYYNKSACIILSFSEVLFLQ